MQQEGHFLTSNSLLNTPNFLPANYPTFSTLFLLKLQISIILTFALELGQLFMFQKFEQTMANLIFDTMDLYYGMKLMRDLKGQCHGFFCYF